MAVDLLVWVEFEETKRIENKTYSPDIITKARGSREKADDMEARIKLFGIKDVLGLWCSH